jgi:hypothetical protein
MGTAEVFWASVLEALMLEVAGAVVGFGFVGGGIWLFDTSGERGLVGFCLVGELGESDVLVTVLHVVFSGDLTSDIESRVSRFATTVPAEGVGLIEGALAMDFFTAGTSGLRLS